VVLQKTGAARWAALDGSAAGQLLEVKVRTAVEEGLLGLAFHPAFAQNGRFFLDYVTSVNGKDTTRIEEWKAENPADLRTSKVAAVRTLLEQEQPYANHNAGQLAFGPDGFLYVGLGDGGSAGDPQRNGQNLGTWLGKMLRIDVDHAPAGQAYAVPADNPFVGRAGARPEIWAYGLRNPWRYVFAPDGRLIVADVGQDQWEEVDVLERGKNYGWNVREAAHCYRPPAGCPTEGLVDPVVEYSHAEGQSVTGGYFYTANDVPALRGKYVFGDYVAGKLWAVDLPAGKTGGPPDVPRFALGKFPILPSTFGQLPDGGVLVADFGGGTVYRIAPAP
jgi:glucose/arabinose dehydrogenase